MVKPIVAAVAAAVLTFAGTQVVGGDSGPGSSAERTAYSAVYALKHKNFGRFCSYLSEELRGNSDACALNNAAGWGQNAVFWALDIFGPGMRILDNYRVDVDGDTVTFVVMLTVPSGAENPYYRFTVEKQPSGKWRITKIRGNVNLVTEAVAARRSREAS